MLKKIGSKIFRKKGHYPKDQSEGTHTGILSESDQETLAATEREYGEIKENRLHLQGADFGRAFNFIRKYPDYEGVPELIEEMYQTNSYSLKGLSYKSAVDILEMMPDHLGAKSIIDGMYKIKREYLKSLLSDVLIFILEVAPDHPFADDLASAIVEKNLTNAYHFINRNTSHPQTKFMIETMFEKDANIAVLLLQEKMDHPEVESIIEGFYGIDQQAISSLTPNATQFIMEVVSDHPFIEDLISHLVMENYIKAYVFTERNPEYIHIELLKEAIYQKQPDLKERLWPQGKDPEA